MTRFKLISAIFLSICSSSSNADVPFVFSSNTPAKASEVNANFNSLDSRVSGIESSSSAKCSSGSSPHTISYSEKVANVGDLISLNSREYRIIKIPFVDFETGDAYSLIVPTLDISGTVAADITFNHMALDNIECDSITISGFRASKPKVSEVRTIHAAVSNNVNIYPTTHLLATTYIQIEVNSTVVGLSFKGGNLEQDTTQSPGDYDFTDNLQTNLMNNDANFVNELDELIDYIKITKEP